MRVSGKINSNPYFMAGIVRGRHVPCGHPCYVTTSVRASSAWDFSKPSLDAHSVHAVQDLLDSFIIARLKGNNLVYCKAGLTNRAEHSQWVPYEHQLFSKGDLIIEGGPSPQSHLVWLQRRPNIKIDGGSLFLWLSASSRFLLHQWNFLFALLLVINLGTKQD